MLYASRVFYNTIFRLAEILHVFYYIHCIFLVQNLCQRKYTPCTVLYIIIIMNIKYYVII